MSDQSSDYTSPEPALEPQETLQQSPAPGAGERVSPDVDDLSGQLKDDGGWQPLSTPIPENVGDTYQIVPEIADETILESDPVAGEQQPTGPTSSPDVPTGDAEFRINQQVDSNTGTVIGVLRETVRRMVDSHELPPKYVADCVKVFAAPGNIDDALETFRGNQVIVIPGSSGSGRHTCAVWLLHSIGGLNLREVRREPLESLTIDDLASERNRGWLLDLRADGDQIQLNLGRTLLTSKHLLETVSSYLAVAIRADLWDQVKAGGEKLAVEMAPPSPLELVRQRLTREKPALSESDANRWLEYPEITRYLLPLSAIEAVVWANAIRAEHFTPLHPADGTAEPDDLTDDTVLKTKAANVIKARSAWRAELLTWHKEHDDSRIRNFMLATAVLEDYPGEEVFTSAQKLAKAFKDDDSSQAPGLTGPGLLELVAGVEAYLTDAETVRFNKAGYADAVLEYFWADRMHLRDSFISWLSELSLSNQGESADSIINRLGQYVLRWSIRRNKIDQLEKVINIWARTKRLAPAAETLVVAAGLDPALGRPMRDRMLIWARNDEEDQNPLKLIVARACSGPLGKVFPKVMFLRLGYVAGTDDPEIAGAVKDAVRTLWELPKTRDTIRTDIAAWYRSGDDVKCRAARRTFAALAGLVNGTSETPLLLVSAGDDGEDSERYKARSFLIEGWRCVLDEPVPDDEVLRAFEVWMDSALVSESVRVESQNIFADAVYKAASEEFNDRRFSTLSDLFYRWGPAGKEITAQGAVRESVLSYVRKRDPLRHPVIASSETDQSFD